VGAEGQEMDYVRVVVVITMAVRCCARKGLKLRWMRQQPRILLDKHCSLKASKQEVEPLGRL